jgi:cell division protein FtsB
MQIHCFHCRAPMHVPDQAAHFGGIFSCPNCRAVNTVGFVAPPIYPTQPTLASAYPLPQQQRKPPSRAGGILAVVVGVAIGSFVLASLAPWLAMFIGLSTCSVALIYIIHEPLRLRTNRLLKLERPSRVLTSFVALGMAGWSFLVLFGMGLWVATGGPERQQAEREARQNELEAQKARQEQERQEAERLAEEERVAAAAAAKAARDAELRANIDKAAADYESGLDEARALVDEGRWAEANAKIGATSAAMTEYQALDPVPASISKLMAREKEMAAQVEPIVLLLQASDRLERSMKRAAEMTKGTKHGEVWTVAQQLWEEALRDIELLEAAARELKSYVPRDLSKRRKPVEAALRKADGIVAKYEQEKLERAAYLAICGERPQGCGGGWDGECIGTEPAFKRVAHDPSDVDVENCSQPVLTKDDCWHSTCTVIARNGFGARVRQRYVFRFSKLGVEVVGSAR